MTDTPSQSRTPVADPPRPADPASESLAARADSMRVGNTIPMTAPHEEVSRDVRARRPSLVAALRRGRALQRLARIASLLALDFVAVWAAIFSALALKEIVRGNFVFDRVAGQTWDYLPFVFLVTALLFARSNLYSRREARPGLVAIVAGLFYVTVVSALFALANGLEFRSYYIFYGGFLFGLAWVAGARWLYERVTGMLLATFGSSRRTVLVGSGDQIEPVARALEDGSPTRYETIGYISLTPRPDNGLRSLGSLEDLPQVLEAHDVQEVVIADPDFPPNEAFELVDHCREHGVAVRIAPTTMEIMTHRHELVPGQGVPLFELKPPVFEGVDFAIKRAFDLVGAVALLVAFSPLLAAIAAGVKVTSRGPVLYRSRRPGIGGQPFDCLKFRTMQTNAEERQTELEEDNEASGPLFKIRSDPRLTPIGGFLRRYSLDELPQLLNVLRGEMSLVGPRPLPERDYERLGDWHRKRYLVLPGITGLWQVSGRAELDFDELVRLDFLYLERWSVFLDLSIMLKTIPAVMKRKGAF